MRIGLSTFIILLLLATISPFYVPIVRSETSTSTSTNLCLTPTAADTTSAQIQPASAATRIAGHVASIITEGKAHLVGGMPSQFNLHIELVFNFRNANQFSSCLASINDPKSSNYGHFLNSTTLRPYLPTPGQKLSIVSYLTSNGLNVTDGPSPLVLKLSASVSTLDSTFGVNVNQYSVGKSNFYGVSSDPSLPQNFAPMITGIIGLNNFTIQRPAETPCGPFPSTPYCAQGLQAGYSFSSLQSNGYTGAGQTVAIVDGYGDPNIQNAINTYDSQYSLPAVTINVQYPDGFPSTLDTGWAPEAAMDVEAVHAAAPGAKITLLYIDTTAHDLLDGIDYVANNHLATIVSNSWGDGCTDTLGTFYWCSDSQLAAQYPVAVASEHSRLMADSALGLTILFASGDEGSKPDGTNTGTEFPASDPNVLAVGGTDLTLTGCGSSTCTGYGSETAWSFSSGGYSGHFSEPSWQISTIGTQTGRAVPDVSMLGDGGAFWVYSTVSPGIAGFCGTASGSAGWYGCGGTSLSTQLWAGFLAVALQLRNGFGFGNIDPMIYKLASSSSYSNDFHDITTGTEYYGVYSAVTGWDPVTGWGSPIANHLASDLAWTPLSLSSIASNVVTAASGSVTFVLPDFNAPRHTSASKCGGVAAAQLTDYSSGGYVLGMVTNVQSEVLDTDPNTLSQVSTTCGKFVASNNVEVIIAGSSVNEALYYNEKVISDTPLYFNCLGDGTCAYVERSTNVRHNVWPLTSGTDYLVIEAFQDSAGHKVYVFTGSGWTGTLAGAAYFNTVIYPNISTYTQSWYIYQWQDATSGGSHNGFPDPGDTYTQIATG